MELQHSPLTALLTGSRFDSDAVPGLFSTGFSAV